MNMFHICYSALMNILTNAFHSIRRRAFAGFSRLLQLATRMNKSNGQVRVRNKNYMAHLEEEDTEDLHRKKGRPEWALREGFRLMGASYLSLLFSVGSAEHYRSCHNMRN